MEDILARVERRPVLSVFALALIVRAVAAVVIAIGWGGSLFLDDASYSRIAQAAADGRLHSLGSYTEWLYERTATLLVPVTGLYEVLGPVKLGGQLYVALLGAATAALTARLALEVLDRRFALLAGLLVALLPSQVLWSSIIMKDAAVWACLSGLAVVAAVAARSAGRRLAALGLAAAGLLVLLAYLRLQTLEVACVALVLAMLVSDRAQRTLRVAVAAGLLLVIPWAYGMGLAGAPYVAGVRDPAGQRQLNAVQAKSAVVATEEPADTGFAGQLRYLPKGMSVVALRPWPWEAAGGGVGLRLARVENVLWYPLVVLALIGLGGAWRMRRALAFPVLCGGAVLVMYGITEGNLGTAFRHRGELVWAVILMATVGIARVARRRQASTRTAPAQASARVSRSPSAT
jgi:4-amino-4-deoxy-L-arabinose transferase-like glycosyltransferase